MNRFNWILALSLVLLQYNTADARKWTDASGKYTFEANLVGVEGDNVRLSIAEDSKEYVIPVRLLSDTDQVFIQRQATSSNTRTREKGGVRPAVLAVIKQKAAAKWPDNYSMQKFQIDQETEAYLHLRSLRDNRVPKQVLNMIRQKAASKWRDNYSMQKFQIKQEIESYLHLQSLQDDRVPRKIFDTIRRKAADKWRDNYSMQKFQIEQEIEAYLALHRGH